MTDPIPLPPQVSPPITFGDRLLGFLQLVRFANVFTAMADILLGLALVNGGFTPVRSLGLLLAASVCHYWTGMIFNDVFDRAIDAEQRPLRPIPSGRVSVSVAVGCGLMLNGGGLILASLVSRDALLVACGLTASIYLYDKVLKKTLLGPVAMGACRFFNVLLGASAALQDSAWSTTPLTIAAGLGIYVAGLTWFAKQEAKWSHRGLLAGAALVILSGLGVIAVLVWKSEAGLSDPTMTFAMLGVIAFTVGRRLVEAIAEPSPQEVQGAIVIMLLSLVMLDATLVVFATGQTGLGLVTAALLVPTFILKKWIPMT